MWARSTSYRSSVKGKMRCNTFAANVTVLWRTAIVMHASWLLPCPSRLCTTRLGCVVLQQLDGRSAVRLCENFT